MRTIDKIAFTLVLLLAVSFIAMHFMQVENDDVGIRIASNWCKERDENFTNVSLCINKLNTPQAVIIQSLTLALFLFVIALTVINMEWRVAAAMLSLVPLVIIGATPPQNLLNAVSWDLIVFLVGSMTLAGVLRELGVFRFIALKVLEVSKGNVIVLLVLLSSMAFLLSAALGEVTSIIYVAMLVLEIGKITRADVTPLIILSVLATNTGSAALPIGNPIGVYLLFQTDMSVSRFIKNAFPLALVNLVVLMVSVLLIERSALRDIRDTLKASKDKIEAYVTSRRIELSSTQVANKTVKRIFIGLVLFVLFTSTVALNDVITGAISSALQMYIDPHAFLSFIPYIYIVAALIMAVPPSEVSKFVEKSVEWPSLLFFIFLFMFGYMLTYTGVMAKLAYGFLHISRSSLALLSIVLFSSAFLSSVLDNLSVVVTFTPIAMVFNNIGLVSNSVFFALLFGGVFGGNYTPIGSTANIIAISLAEKRKIRVSWGRWLRIALIPTTLQLLVSFTWLYATTYALSW